MTGNRRSRSILDLADKELADIGLTRSGLGEAHRSFVIDQLRKRQRVLTASSLRGMISSAGIALLLGLALLMSERRPIDYVALVSCPLFHPGIMGSAPSDDKVGAASWIRCEIKTP